MKLKVRYNYAEEVCSPYHEGYSWKAYQTSVTVEIKELSDAEAPLAFVLHRNGKPDQDVRVLDGQYYWNVQFIDTKGDKTVPFGLYNVTTQNVIWNDFFLKFSLMQATDRKLPAQKKVLDKANSIIIVEGKVYSRESEPVYEVQDLEGKRLFLHIVPKLQNRHGKRFSALNRDSLHEFIYSELSSHECKDNPFEDCKIDVLDKNYVHFKRNKR